MYPSYFSVKGLFYIWLNKFSFNTYDCSLITLAVLLVGKSAQSPIANTFLKFALCRVSILTLTKPVSLAKQDSEINRGAR